MVLISCRNRSAAPVSPVMSIIAGTSAIAVATCVALYGGAMRADLGRRRAALLAGAGAVLLGGWLAASAGLRSSPRACSRCPQA
jgi:hypothetical protein